MQIFQVRVLIQKDPDFPNTLITAHNPVLPYTWKMIMQDQDTDRINKRYDQECINPMYPTTKNVAIVELHNYHYVRIIKSLYAAAFIEQEDEVLQLRKLVQEWQELLYDASDHIYKCNHEWNRQYLVLSERTEQFLQKTQEQ